MMLALGPGESDGYHEKQVFSYHSKLLSRIYCYTMIFLLKLIGKINSTNVSPIVKPSVSLARPPPG